MYRIMQAALNTIVAHPPGPPSFLSPSAPATAPSSILTPFPLSESQGRRSQSPSYASAGTTGSTGTPATTMDISSAKKKTPAKPHEIILKTSVTALEHRFTTKALVTAVNQATKSIAGRQPVHYTRSLPSGDTVVVFEPGPEG